jgi:DNA polymerase-1
MEYNGVCIDNGLLSDLDKEISSSLKKEEKEIYKLAGAEFNINSPKQLSEVLYGKLKLPIVKKTKTGISTDEWTLRRLAEHHELPNQLLRFRELAKLKSTYIYSLPKLTNPKTGRVHTSFNQTVTATGRLSSSQPNLQNIPIKTELGRSIRKLFIPTGKNNLILCCDYSQIELRILAHLSKDRVLINAFNEDLDIHTHTASLVFGVDEDKIDEAMRNTAKTVNFGIVYGMSAFGLSRDLGIDIEKARDFIDSYFIRYPGVKAYIGDCIQEAREQGYVTTIMNRRRYIPEIMSEDIKIRQFAERTAINTPIQGSAADVMKVAMIDVDRALRKKKMRTKMMLQVHDELVFDVPKDELDEVKVLVKEHMEGVMELKVPIKAKLSVGKNWLEVK